MFSLIPFENRSPAEPAPTAHAAGPEAPIVDVATLHGSRTRKPASRRRDRRNWDPAFHVDLLTF